jgi:hypothetical protein
MSAFLLLIVAISFVMSADISGKVTPVPEAGQVMPTMFISGDRVRRTSPVAADGSFTMYVTKWRCAWG